MPVGNFLRAKEHFQTQTVKIEKGDMVYMFSDGLQDQLGGKNQKKFLLKNLTATLIEIHNDPLNEQRVALEQEIISWRGGISQIDDMTMVGIKVWYFAEIRKIHIFAQLKTHYEQNII